MESDNESPLRYSRRRKRYTSVEEEAELNRLKEYKENLELKKDMLRKEFEKNQKENMVNISEAVRSSEAKLRKQVDELTNINENKIKQLISLNEQLANTEFALDIASSYHNIANKKVKTYESESSPSPSPTLVLHGTQMSPEQLRKIMASHYSINEIIKPEHLYERLANLKEALNEIEGQIDIEKDTTNGIMNKLNELKKDTNLLIKRNNELKSLNEHAEKRFHDLKKIEFLAKTKLQTTRIDLSRESKSLDSLKKQENNFMQMQKNSADEAYVQLTDLQGRISEMLLTIDESKKRKIECEDKIKDLDRHYEIMMHKRVNSKFISKYIDILQELEKELFQKKEPQSRSPQSKALFRQSTFSIGTRRKSPLARGKSNQFRNSCQFSSSPSSPLLRIKSNLDSILDTTNTKNTSISRKSQIFKTETQETQKLMQKIYQYYESHQEGPNHFINKAIERYREMIFQNMSLKNLYEDMADEKLKKEELYSQLTKELNELKQHHPHHQGQNLNQNEQGTKDEEDQRNEDELNNMGSKEAIDSGIMIINNKITTINQADTQYENKEILQDTLMELESFIFRMYLDFIELLMRFSKYIQAISDQSGGLVSVDLEKICADIVTCTNEFCHAKKLKDKYSNEHGNLGGNKLDTQSSLTSEYLGLNLEGYNVEAIEIMQIFLNAFNNSEKPFKNNNNNIENGKKLKAYAYDFIRRIRQDPFIISFLGPDDYKAYLMNKLSESITKNDAIKAIFGNIIELKDKGIQIMITNFKSMMKYYVELIDKLLANRAESYDFFKRISQNIETIDPEIIIHKYEPSEHVKRMNQQKSQAIKAEKLDRDRILPIKKEDEEAMMNKGSSENELQNLDYSQLKLKIYEIAHIQFKKAKGVAIHDGSNLTTPYAKFNPGSKNSSTQVDEPSNNLHVDEEVLSNKIEHTLQKRNIKIKEILDQERKRIKHEFYSRSEPKTQTISKSKKMDQDIQRLSQVENLEIKKMIQNSKVLQKISFLEKKQYLTEAKISLKTPFTENYIPLTTKPNTASLTHRISNLNSEFKFGFNDSTTHISPLKSTQMSKLRDESLTLNHDNNYNIDKKDFKLDLKLKSEISLLKSRTCENLNSKTYSNKKDLSINPKIRYDQSRIKKITTTTTSSKHTRRSDSEKKNLPDITSSNNSSTRPSSIIRKIKNKIKPFSPERYTSLDTLSMPTFFTATYNPDLLPSFEYKFDSFKTTLKPVLVQKTDYQVENQYNHFSPPFSFKSQPQSQPTLNLNIDFYLNPISFGPNSEPISNSNLILHQSNPPQLHPSSTFQSYPNSTSVSPLLGPSQYHIYIIYLQYY